MQVSLELGKELEEVLSWDPDKFAMWVEFFKMAHERANKKTGKR